MADKDLTRTIVGICGNVISGCLFLSPVPTFLTIMKKKSVQAYKPDPYLATLFNCAMWIFYGLPVVSKDNLLVYTINGAGFVIELVYVVIFLIYSNGATRKKMTLILVFEVVFMVVIVLVVMGLIHSLETRKTIVGIICIVLNILMYAAPLTVMKRVITTRSVKYMPLLLSVANLANGCVWLAYALLKFDLFITVPNGLGAVSGVIQLGLYATYYKTTDWDAEDEEQQPGIELPKQKSFS